MTADFSFKRLLQLIGKQWAEHRRFYWMSCLALLGLMAIVFAFWVFASGTHYEEETLYGIGLFGLFITGAIFASSSFSMLGNKDRAIYWISFPASHLEKLLVVLFFQVILFSLVYIGCFYLLKSLAMYFVEYMISNQPGRFQLHRMDWQEAHGLASVLPHFICTFFVVQAAYLLGSVAFKKFSFIITTILLSLLVFVLVFYIQKIVKDSFHGYGFDLFELTDYRNRAVGDNRQKVYAIGAGLKYSILIFLKYLLAPLLWVVIWLKLKEKQI